MTRMADGSRSGWRRLFWGVVAGWIGVSTAFQANAAGVVSVADEAHLRQALNGGGTVTFACDGTIYLASTVVVTNDAVLDASGHSIALSGSNAVRVLTVNTGVNLTLRSLTVCQGFSTKGAGIYNSGTVVLFNILISSNRAQAIWDYYQPLNVEGGGIYNLGDLRASSTVFSANAARGAVGFYADSAPASFGGGLYNLGKGNLTNCVFTGNRADANGDYTPSYPLSSQGAGGAVFNGGILSIVDCEFANCCALGGKGSERYQPALNGGGWAAGGALFSTNSTAVWGCLFVSNTVVGGIGGRGPDGESYSVFRRLPPEPGYAGGRGGDGYGGAVHVSRGTTSIINSTLFGNGAQGGTGGAGGGGGAGILIVRGVGGADGGNGGNGGDGLGGGVSVNDGVLNLTNVTIASNNARSGGGGAFGLGGPGGSYNGTPCQGLPGANGPAGVAFGENLWRTAGTLALKNSIVAYGGKGGNAFGLLTDFGNNISSDATCAFNQSSSRNKVDPQAGPLLDWGGPTKTMAIIAGGPAVDAADAEAGPTTDQRGLARPVGAGPDIGAFEGSIALPKVDAAFTPPQIPEGGIARLSLTISNANSFALNNVVITNSLPPEVTISSVPDTSTDCAVLLAPANQRTIVLLRSNLSPHEVCVATVNVTSSNRGGWSNPALQVSSWETGGWAVTGNGALGVKGVPIVLSAGVVGVETNGATLGGLVNPCGFETLCFFEYGITTNLGNATPAVILGADFAAGATAASLTNLPLNTTFYYRQIATSSAGVAYGQIQSFFTLGSVSVPDETHFLANARRGGRITFQTNGTIFLSQPFVVSTNTEIDGTGFDVTISGSNAVCVFNIEPGATLTLRNLTIAEGRSTNGGAVYNLGTFNAARTAFLSNMAIGNAGNRGTDGTNGTNDRCNPNTSPGTRGGNGGAGGAGYSSGGGALFNEGQASFSGCSFVNNRAVGGSGGDGGKGGLSGYGSKSGDGGIGGTGGEALGGAVYNASCLLLTNCTFIQNSSFGGLGGRGGDGSYRSGDAGVGGNGGHGGNSFGGAIFSDSGSVFAMNVTFASALANSGDGGLPGKNAWGSYDPKSLPGTNGVSAAHNLMNQTGSFMLKNCIVANPSGLTNASGVFADLGHNLSSDASCGFTHPASLANTDPRLGPLGDYGGPTRTVALLPGSPAIDAGDSDGGPAVDQRGVPRPQGSRCDIGAFEFTRANVGVQATQARCEFSAVPNRSYAVEASTNLFDWFPLLQVRSEADGVLRFEDEITATPRFYRTSLLAP